jgi:hypothetical protein
MSRERFERLFDANARQPFFMLILAGEQAAD